MYALQYPNAQVFCDGLARQMDWPISKKGSPETPSRHSSPIRRLCTSENTGSRELSPFTTRAIAPAQSSSAAQILAATAGLVRSFLLNRPDGFFHHAPLVLEPGNQTAT